MGRKNAVRPMVLAAMAAMLAAAAPAQDPAGPSLAQFPREVWRDFGQLFRIGNVAPLLVGLAASGVAAPHDAAVERFFTERRRWRGLGDTGQACCGLPLSSAAAGGLLLASRVAGGARFRAFTYGLAESSVLNLGLASAVKEATRRERPNHQDRRSFYSSHTAGAFAWAALAQRHYGIKAAIPAYAAALLIGASRLESNKHHLTDVAAGATVGYIVGSTVGRGRGRSWSVAPVPGGLAFAWRLP